MTSSSSDVLVIEWSRGGALSLAMKALRANRPVELVFAGRAAKLLTPHVKRFLDDRVSLGWSDLWIMLRTLRFHTAYFYAESGGRTARARTEGDRLIVEFERPRPGSGPGPGPRGDRGP
jgi:hypothetical protein